MAALTVVPQYSTSKLNTIKDLVQQAGKQLLLESQRDSLLQLHHKLLDLANTTTLEFTHEMPLA